MTKLNVNKVTGESFEDLSIAEMTRVQGTGDIDARFTTSPACLYSIMVVTKTSSNPCLGLGAASLGGLLSIRKC